MKHYRLTDEDARAIAIHYAKAKSPIQGHQTEQDWFSDFIDKYNKIMDEINRYHNASGDCTD